MNHRRRTPLFEVIPNESMAREKMKIPTWWKGSQDGRRETPGGFRHKRGVHRLTQWLHSPARVTLPLGAWAGIAVTVIVLTGLTIVLVRTSRRDLTPEEAKSQQLAGQMRSINSNPLLLQGLSTREREAYELNDAGVAVTSAGGRGDYADDGDPRTPGLNYFCLVTIPADHQDELERAVGFLKENKVDTAIIPVENSQVQLIVLRGFERPNSDPQAQEFKQMLRTLGRVWKAKHGGASDWHDVYPVKYVPRRK